MYRLTALSFFIISLLPIISFNPYKVTPPGTTRFNDSLFVDIAEISNLDWKEYSYWLKNMYGDNSKEYKSCFPDSTVWLTSIYEQVAKSYFKHPAYLEFPIVGITYEQAVAYCEWRSIQVNYMLYLKQNKLDYRPRADTVGIVQIYKYRLLTKEEWEAIAALGFSPKTKKKIASKRNYNPNVYNLIYPKHEGMYASNAVNLHATAEVKSLWENAIGCYHIFGNVAEMTNKKGIAKGGAWLHNVNDVFVDKDFYYKGAQNWVGIRCICEKVLKSEKEIIQDSLKLVKIEEKHIKDSIKNEKKLQRQRKNKAEEDDDDYDDIY